MTPPPPSSSSRGRAPPSPSSSKGPARPPCSATTAASRALRSPARFAEAFPTCAAEPLDALALARVAGRSFWQGGTVHGVRLGQPRSAALAALGVAPIDPNLAGPESWFDPSGLVVRFAGDPGDEASWRVAELVVVGR